MFEEKYSRYHKIHAGISMADNNLNTIAEDIDNLVQHVQVLLTDNSGARKTGVPLGNNSVPHENIPFSSSLGTMNSLNPFEMMQSFISDSAQPYQNVTLERIDTRNKHSNEIHYASAVDLQNMDAYKFYNETFENMDNNEKPQPFPKDPLIQVYYGCLGIIGIYILFSLTNKRR